MISDPLTHFHYLRAQKGVSLHCVSPFARQCGNPSCPQTDKDITGFREKEKRSREGAIKPADPVGVALNTPALSCRYLSLSCGSAFLAK